MATSDERALDQELARLEEEERDISLMRRKLHDRLAIFPEGPNLVDLEAREAELSKRRRDLHKRIDELRARRSALRSRTDG